MAKDLSLSQTLFQSLLDHFWNARDKGLPRQAEQFPKGYCISYGDLIKASGVPLNSQNSGGPLYEVAIICQSFGWPGIHSLVVRAYEGYPGPGYFKAPGTRSVDLKDEVIKQIEWAEEVCRCANFEGFPKTVPTSY